MMVLEEPDQKGQCLRVLNMNKENVSTCSFWTFFPRIRIRIFPDPDFWPIRIRIQEKKFDPDPEKKIPDPKH